MTERVTRVPNKYIRCDIKKQYGISRKFYVTYILIDRYRSVEDFSWITIRKVLEYCGCKNLKRKPKAFWEILDVLEFMINNNMIKVTNDLNSLDFDTGVEIKVIAENFDSLDRFTRITSTDFDCLMVDESSINKENLLLAFLYVASYIGCRPRDEKPSDSPEAFYQDLHKMAATTALSRQTVDSCMKNLVSNGLLIKRQTDGKQLRGGGCQETPNIYVLNNERCEQEIEWALKKMSELYKKPTDEISGGNEIKTEK